MSSGNFVIRGYETDGGSTMPITVQPETLALTIGGVANAASAGIIDDNFGSARVSGGDRQIGLKARSVSIKFTAAKTGYAVNSTITLPVLRKSVHDGYSKGQVGTYLDTAVEVVGVPKGEGRR